MATSNKLILTGTFQISSWDESTYLTLEDNIKQSHAKITQTYVGDIDGTSEIQYLMSYQGDGNAVFIGFETMTATISGKATTVVLQHSGKFENGIASSKFDVTHISGALADTYCRGQGTFTAEKAGSANYQVALTGA